MSTNVEQASSHIQATGTVASSSSSTSGPKISMFAAKSGFVIPKNKLSGSLVPIFRGGKKGSEDSVNEESSKQVRRKTRWGPDLTQDTAVRKGRALAYQTRVDQITKQLSSGTLESVDNQDLFSDSQSASHILNNESKLLEIEKREAIGEVLKLNPAYKAPADYTPLLKEDKVPIPIKDYPGFNFIALVFGTAKDTQKRLEKETGAKIRVYGKKANTRDEVEVTTSENETAGAYEELCVHVSADTYDKVDAAVALIELLVTPVSVNTASGSATSTVASGQNENSVDISQSTPSSETSVVLNLGMAQQTAGSAPAFPLGNFESYRGPWFPTGLNQTPVLPTSGYMAPANPSAPLLNHPVQVSSAPYSNMPSIFGPRPIMAAGFASVAQNPPLFPSRPQLPPVMQQQYGPQSPSLGNSGIPRNLWMPVLQPVPSQSNSTNPAQYSVNQPTPAPPLMVHSGTQSMPQSAPPTFSNGGSPGWSHPALSTSQPLVLSGPPAVNISPSNMVSPISYLSNTHPGAAINRPIAASSFHSAPQSQVGVSAPAPSLMQSSSTIPTNLLMSQVAMPPPAPNHMIGSPSNPLTAPSTLTQPLPHSGIPNSASASSPDFSSKKPPLISGPRPQQPNLSDFTFQPHRPQNPVSQMVARPPPNQTMQQPQSPSLQPGMHISNPSPAVQGFPRPQVRSQMGQPRAQMSTNFAGNPVGPSVPLVRPTFPNPNSVSPGTVPQVQPRNFNLAPPVVNPAGPFPPRAGNPMQFQQNFPGPATQPRNLLPPNQQLNTNFHTRPGHPASGSSRPQQVYDPFSPTSLSFNPHLSGDQAKVQKQESDPEYEDLMASVGVK